MAGQLGQPKYGFGWPDGRLGGLGPPGQREARPLLTRDLIVTSTLRFGGCRIYYKMKYLYDIYSHDCLYDIYRLQP